MWPSFQAPSPPSVASPFVQGSAAAFHTKRLSSQFREADKVSVTFISHRAKLKFTGALVFLTITAPRSVSCRRIWSLPDCEVRVWEGAAGPKAGEGVRVGG